MRIRCAKIQNRKNRIVLMRLYPRGARRKKTTNQTRRRGKVRKNKIINFRFALTYSINKRFRRSLHSLENKWRKIMRRMNVININSIPFVRRRAGFRYFLRFLALASTDCETFEFRGIFSPRSDRICHTRDWQRVGRRKAKIITTSSPKLISFFLFASNVYFDFCWR